MGIGSILTFAGLGLATPVPTLSQFAVLSLTMFVIALTWWRQHRAKAEARRYFRRRRSLCAGDAADHNDNV
jgi:hypothetical protein